MNIETPRLASTLPSRLSDGLQALPRLQELTISNPPVVQSVPILKAVRCLKLIGLPEYSEEWAWLADVKGLEEIEVSISEESIHVYDKEAVVNGLGGIWMNLPAYMRDKVLSHEGLTYSYAYFFRVAFPLRGRSLFLPEFMTRTKIFNMFRPFFIFGLTNLRNNKPSE